MTRAGRRQAGLLGCSLILAIVAAACGSPGATTSPDPPADLALTTLADGAPTTLAGLRGSPVLLSSWATWCGECKPHLPDLEGLWKARGADGLAVVAVNVDGPGINREIAPMVEGVGLTMPVWLDPHRAFATAFGMSGVPSTVLLDRSGHVIRRWLGPVDFMGDDVIDAVDVALEASR